MPSGSEPVVGKVVKGPVRAVAPTEGFSALMQVVEMAQRGFVVYHEESSKRRRLDAYQETEVKRIKEASDRLRQYFDLAFAERRAVYEEMFTRLDRALDSENNEALHSVVLGIVDLAKTSPLANMGDLAQVRAALDDPDQVWDL